MVERIRKILDLRDKLEWNRYKEDLRKRKKAPTQFVAMPPIECDPNSVWIDVLI